MGKARKGSTRDAARRRGAPDGAIYIGLVMIGAFGVWLWTIVAPGPDSWKHGLLGYVIALLVLVNLSTWRTCLGHRVAPWQQSLARLVLRWAGYGNPGGRPLEAAHGSHRARTMLLVSLATSVLLVGALAWLLFVA